MTDLSLLVLALAVAYLAHRAGWPHSVLAAASDRGVRARRRLLAAAAMDDALERERARLLAAASVRDGEVELAERRARLVALSDPDAPGAPALASVYPLDPEVRRQGAPGVRGAR